jgi:two-component system cell cycle response regulator DivK
MSHSVLVVEDNAPNLELLVDWLESEGFRVQTATTLNEARAVLQSGSPDIVLLDVQLGPEDGLSLIADIRKTAQVRPIPVIAVTAHAMVTDFERVVRAGCDACVSKPINFRALREQLDKWLAEHLDRNLVN